MPVSIPEDQVLKALDEALRGGAEYVEVRFQVDEIRSVSVRNGELQFVSSVSYGGVSIRSLVNGMFGFSATNNLDWDSIRDAVTNSIRSARALSRLRRRRVVLSQERPARITYEVPQRRRLEDLGSDYLVKYLVDIDGIMRTEPRIKVRNLSINVRITHKFIVNSEGARVISTVPRISFFGVLIAHDPERGSAQRNIEWGGSGGFEVMDGLENEVKREVEVIGKVLDEARPLPHDDVMDVVLGPELAGIMVHESVGHPFELDRIMGREGAEAGESYLRVEDLGRFRLGSDQVTIIDDPTIPGSYGFYLVDEEGVTARPRYLVRNGVVNELLTNREYAGYLGIRSTAAARSSEFDKEPIPRMANTYLAPGDWKPEEIIRDTRRGLYIVSYTEWNIDDRRWFGRYGGFEAYLIENGELKGMVRNPFIEVNTGYLWSHVDAVANDLRFFIGTCGKGNPMQGVPVFLGGPTFRVRSVRVLKSV
ncbi:TldD/PmbA family protein [Vulcanisaeta thermophila]|uniref:TldD/PmbA family protein n=1 Tax=Vulcanisaeta thermophila TaxID=867917 RepID=UPI0008531FA8|nr:TldD/PmbA family protein [Vulcanisaeta thermophila]